MADFASSLPIRTESAGDVIVQVCDSTIPSQRLLVNADGSINTNSNISATDLDIRDLSHAQDSIKIGDGSNLLAINSDGSINIKIKDESPGSEIIDYSTDNALAANATGVHTYTSTGNFYLTQIEASGSGKMKATINIGGVPKFVQFNSTATPNMGLKLDSPILVTTGQTVTIDRLNRENQPQDVYSTIMGYYE